MVSCSRSWAFHGPHARAPVAIESASLERSQDGEALGRLDPAGDDLDGGGVVEVTPGRDVDQQQVVLDQHRDGRAVLFGEPDPGRHLRD